MQYSEFRWISLADILDFKQPTGMKFQSVFELCNKWYVQFGETFYMLVTNVFCKESVSTTQVVAKSILFSLHAGVFHIYP